MEHLLRIGHAEFWDQQNAPSGSGTSFSDVSPATHDSSIPLEQLSLPDQVTNSHTKVSKSTTCLYCHKTFRHGGRPIRFTYNGDLELMDVQMAPIDAKHLRKESDRGFHPNCRLKVRRQVEFPNASSKLDQNKTPEQERGSIAAESFIPVASSTKKCCIVQIVDAARPLF